MSEASNVYFLRGKSGKNLEFGEFLKTNSLGSISKGQKLLKNAKIKCDSLSNETFVG